MSVETVIDRSCQSVGEGPHWVQATGTLLYVDILTGTIRRWDSVTGNEDKYVFDENVSFIVPCQKGGYIIGLGQTISHFNWETKKLTVLHKVEEGKNTRFNDGKCDASGRLWCGTMAHETEPGVIEPEQGSLYSLEVDGSLKKHKDKISISNGLAWSADNKTMYYIDSSIRKVWAYDFDMEAGLMSNQRDAVDFGDETTPPTNGSPDGMAIDTDGKLWVACFFAGKVSRYDPNTGEELTKVSIPAMRTTSCCFGGKNYDELFVTSARTGMTDEEKETTPLAGSVFKVTGLGVKGSPAPVYMGSPSV